MAGDRAAGRGQALSSDAIFTAGDLAFRPIVEDDIPRLAAWLRDPEVGRWWHGLTETYDEDFVRGHVLKQPHEDHVTQTIVELRGAPIGFQQWYALAFELDSLEEYGFTAADDVYGIDQFIGESRLHNQGIGTRQVRAVVEWLLGPSGPGARVVVTDPVVENLRAIRCYEKAGFEIAKRLRGHEMLDGEPRDSWLMVATE